MSYQSRRKKRAYQRAAAESRRKPDTARRWFLTLAKRPGRFDCCGRQFKRDDRILYRHQGHEIRCEGCGTRDGLPVRRSQRIDRATRAAA
jgi:hypothetical protein